MITCVLNAAEGQLDIVLGIDDKILCSQRWYVPIKQAIRLDEDAKAKGMAPHITVGGTEILTQALEAMCALVSIKPTDIRRWACVNGPGSFTGIRLVLSTVAAICRVTGAHSAPLDFMQVLAATAQSQDHALAGTKSLEYWVLTHARRDIVHCEVFHCEEGLPTSKEPVFLCSPAHVAERIIASTAPAVVLGSGFQRNKSVLGPALYPHLYPHGLIVPLACTNPNDSALWHLAQRATYTDCDIDPLYVRACDAVENLPHIAKNMGINPEVAQARLHTLLSK